MKRILGLFIAAGCMAVLFGCDREKYPQPPVTKTVNVIDTIFGTPVPDPYRWLENSDDPEVRAWTDSQHAYLATIVAANEDYAAIRARVEKLLSIGSIDSLQGCGDRLFFERRTAGSDQPVLFVREADGSERALIDLNEANKTRPTSLDWWYLSPDCRLMLYGVSLDGTENSVGYVMDIATGQNLADTIPYMRAAAVSWQPDAEAFYYTRYPEPGSVPPGEENYYRRVYLHQIGHDWRTDPLIYEATDDKSLWTSQSLSPDGRWLTVAMWESVSTKRVELRDLSRRGQFSTIAEGNGDYLAVAPLDQFFLAQTNRNAPRGRIMRGEYASPGFENWTEVIPEFPKGTIESCLPLGDYIVVHLLENAASRLLVYDMAGALKNEIPLPSIGSVSGLSGDPVEPRLSFTFYSFATPKQVYRYDCASATLDLIEQVGLPEGFPEVDVKQVWYESFDGTPVSMFVIHKKGLKLDGTAPTYVYGYGGFGVKSTPFYSSSIPFWVELGGVYAIPNIRGGGEYGREWHESAILENRPVSFKDFISAAEYLIKERYTNSDKLVLAGGSNGGLLVGAVLTMRPDLAKVIVCGVPLLDMIRYHQFLVARYWIPEFGSSEDSTQFEYLLDYSPYHNIDPGAAYPAVILSAGESDGRVHPLHARKMAAALQAAGGSGNPIVVRIEGQAGHGQGKPISKVVDEVAERWAFVLEVLDLDFRR